MIDWTMLKLGDVIYANISDSPVVKPYSIRYEVTELHSDHVIVANTNIRGRVDNDTQDLFTHEPLYPVRR